MSGRPGGARRATGARSGALVIVEPQMALFHYLEVAHRRGFETVVLSSNPDACRAGEREHNHAFAGTEASHIDDLLECATGNPTSILGALAGLRAPIAGIVAGDDHFVPVTAAVGRALGFEYAPEGDALAQQRKSDMKRRLAAAGVPTPSFAIAGDFASATAAWERFGRDCVIKMVDYQGSMNVSRVRSADQLGDAWAAIRQNLRRVDIQMPLAEEVLLEEFVPGRELSAEGYVEEDRVVVLNYCEKITAPNFVVIGHYMPALLSGSERDAATPVVERCVRALGIQNAVFHVELHLRNGAPYIIEAAARPPGQHMVELMERSYGWNLMEIVIDLATGAPVTVAPAPPRKHYAMLALYAEDTGKLTRVRGWEELRARPDVLRTRLDLRPGDPVRALETFRDRYGFVIVEHDTASAARDAAHWIREQVALEVDAGGSAD